ncbi:hypothetical protein GCM10025772_01810 [Ferrimonas gelatinilytica]|uniref:Uncharacterized protein n=1 Tax=Ferrimonas gelatinilytica TaxID=1255257 RepID=A0ABP9RSM4_9GAMM
MGWCRACEAQHGGDVDVGMGVGIGVVPRFPRQNLPGRYRMWDWDCELGENEKSPLEEIQGAWLTGEVGG